MHLFSADIAEAIVSIEVRMYIEGFELHHFEFERSYCSPKESYRCSKW
jgi:hypothetical protein